MTTEATLILNYTSAFNKLIWFAISQKKKNIHKYIKLVYTGN